MLIGVRTVEFRRINSVIYMVRFFTAAGREAERKGSGRQGTRQAETGRRRRQQTIRRAQTSATAEGENLLWERIVLCPIDSSQMMFCPNLSSDAMITTYPSPND